jgi:hypothetical protein
MGAKDGPVSLRGNPAEEVALLPDGRRAVVRVGIADDGGYVARRDLNTVALEVLVDGRVAATLNTVLDTDQGSEALELAREVAARLESGDLEPTAGDLEPLADELR